MTPPRLVGYARVSTEGQETEGASIEAQRAALRGWAAAQGGELAELHTDVASARTLDRPGLHRALAASVGGALVVVKLDRLTRSVRDLGELLAGPFAAGAAQLVAVRDSIDTSNAAGRLVLHVLCSVAQWEREAVSERTREALAHLRRGGVYLGRPPFGFEAHEQHGQRVLVPCEHEQTIVEEMRQLAKGGLRPSRIAAAFNARGVPTRNGGRWHARTVARALGRDHVTAAPFEVAQHT
jgi:DNA invertase Pin-like site-specific DNA recombinase